MAIGRRRVYLDEIEVALMILQEAGLSVSIRDSEFEYADLAELIQQRGEAASEVVLWGRKELYGSIWITFHPTGIRLLATDPHPDFLLAWQRLNDALPGERKPRSVIEPWVWLAGAVVGGVSHFILSPPGDVSDFLQGLMLPVGWLAMGALYHITLGPVSFVHLKHKHEVKGFFARNKDQVILLLVGAVVALVLSEIVRALLQ